MCVDASHRKNICLFGVAGPPQYGRFCPDWGGQAGDCGGLAPPVNMLDEALLDTLENGSLDFFAIFSVWSRMGELPAGTGRLKYN